MFNLPFITPEIILQGYTQGVFLMANPEVELVHLSRQKSIRIKSLTLSNETRTNKLQQRV